jgi:hypothetical protein
MMRVADLIPMPDDPEAWMRRIAGPGLAEDTTTADGWPARLIQAGGRLYAFYRFYSHAGWAEAPATAEGRARLLTVRPDFGAEPFLLSAFWS